jgi:hypothetical protein
MYNEHHLFKIIFYIAQSVSNKHVKFLCHDHDNYIHFDEQPIIEMVLCITYKAKKIWISILPNSIDITLFNENEYINVTK